MWENDTMTSRMPHNVPAGSDDSFAGPSWDLSKEYPSVESARFAEDLAAVRAGITEAARLAERIVGEVPRARELGRTSRSVLDAASSLLILDEKINVLAKNMKNYVNAILSVDGSHGQARTVLAELDQCIAEQQETVQPLRQLLLLASDEFIDALFAHPETRPFAFAVRSSRWWRPHLLGLAEEALVTRLELNGPKAFSNLYDNIQSTLTCSIPPRTMGIARAGGLLQSPDEAQRRQAYEAIVAAWKTQQESCAAGLNGLAGWRTDLYARRSHAQPLHFLDVPLHGARIERATLDAMMSAVDANRELGRRALRLRARALGKAQLGPWDLFAPAPQVGTDGAVRFPFEQGLSMVREAFAAIHPEMGEFVDWMARERNIEGSLGDRKRPGAYQEDFPKSRTPRIYMTYKGGRDDIGTLAHELGHAFHSWALRDLPRPETDYPMTLAETASIFAETVLSDYLCTHTSGPADLLGSMWNDISNIDSMLLNIPARFEFERRLYEARPNRLFTPDELSALMVDAWRKYYGDSLSEMHGLFWASKLHFHMADISFYNFPYTFGYLFSLGVYARRAELGDGFYPAYVALLRDTGRMTAEDLARKHLGVDLREPKFWAGSMGIIAGKLDAFSAVLSDCGIAPA